MADGSTPSRVKRLFSSFLTNFTDEPTHRTLQNSDVVGAVEEENLLEKPGACSDARNRVLFYQRVETYSALTWFAKPPDLSPLVCARYGWVNVDTDMLQCVNCKVFLCGSLPKEVDAFSYKESRAKLKKNLKDTHLTVCKWLTNPSPEFYATVPFHNKEELMNDFVYRLQSLKSLEVLAVSYSTLNKLGVSEETLEQMLESILNTSAIRETHSKEATVLAVTGWSNCEAQLNVLQCLYCRRKLGLWNYRSDSSSGHNTITDVNSVQTPQNSQCNEDKTTNTSCEKDSKENGHIDGDLLENGTRVPLSTDDSVKDASVEEPVKKRPKLEKQSLDPITEHRYWCPWVQQTWSGIMPASLVMSASLSTDASEKDLQAWHLVARLLGSSTEESDNFNSKMKKSPQVDSLRHLRRVLRDCTSPDGPNLPIVSTDQSA